MTPNTPQKLETPQDFGAYLRRQRHAQGLTLDALAAATGISKPYLSNIETARAPGPPSDEKLRKIAAVLSLNPDELLAHAAWLRTPERIRSLLRSRPAVPRHPDGTINLDRLLQLPVTSSLTTPKPAAIPNTIPLKTLPLINRVAAGHATEFTDLNYPPGIADAYVPSPDFSALPAPARHGPIFATRVTGDSMAPEYLEGDILILGDGDPQSGDDCLVRLDAQEAFATTFKRVYFDAKPQTASSVRLVPLNPQHNTRMVSMEQITGIYPVLWKMTPVRRDKA